MGDDHTCESSTSAHQSEFAFVDYMMPILNPAGVQEILDYGILGFALSRYAGVWVGLKCVKDNIEATATVDGRIDRIQIKIPDDFTPPPGGLNIRLGDQALAKEARLHDFKRAAILAFARANGFDRIVTSGGPAPKVGIVTTGKSYLDVRAAMDELGIDEVAANRLGLRLYKVGMPWPLEPQGLLKFAQGLDLILVVEEKRALIETQVKEQLYDLPNRPRVLGKKDENEQWLFPAKYALDPVRHRHQARRAPDPLPAPATTSRTRSAELKRIKGNRPEGAEAAIRIPYFCPGCPHNSSTVVPQGSRAYAGIGCHYMAHWMDRNTEGFTQMGGEGSNWIGEAPFSKTRHVFQNLGDGTYIHSGSLAIRAARAAGVNITFKILYNDAVAMTGGQSLDGGLTVSMMARQVLAEGVEKVVVVTDEPHKYPSGFIPAGVPVYHRRDLQSLQEDLRKVPGVSVLIYDQTCAAEKRRRRKRGTFPDPDKRVFINPAVCEGCGDCGVKSNCVAVMPLETELGTKRAIDQSACNKDFSCVEGFCPSFVTVHGAKVRKSRTAVRGDSGVTAMLASLPEPKLPALDTPYTMLVTGVGGTGVVTVSAVLGQAAHLEGKGFGAIDMTGLAQKGGAVACHMRVAKDAEQIHAIRAGVAGADLVLGCDLVVTASNAVLATIKPDHTAVVYSDYEMHTAQFTRNANIRVPGPALRHAIAERAGKGPVHHFDAHTAAVKLFGDSIAANIFLLGYAYQLGCGAHRRGGHRAGHRAQRRRGGDEQGRLPLRPPGRARHGRRRAHHGRRRRRRRPPRRRRWRTSSPTAPASSPPTRTRRWPSATAPAWRPSPRRSAPRRRAGRASPRRWRAATTSCSPTRTSTRWRGCSPTRPSRRRSPSSSRRAASCSSTWRRRCWRAATSAPASRARWRSGAGCCLSSACSPRASPARHRLGPVRLHARAPAGAADDRRLREAARRDRPAPLARHPRHRRSRSPACRWRSRASATSRSATTSSPRAARRRCSPSCAARRRRC